jgi:hypothetical protein
MVKANCSIQLVYWDLKVSSKIIESKVKVNSMIMKTALTKGGQLDQEGEYWKDKMFKGRLYSESGYFEGFFK